MPYFKNSSKAHLGWFYMTALKKLLYVNIVSVCMLLQVLRSLSKFKSWEFVQEANALWSNVPFRLNQ